MEGVLIRSRQNSQEKKRGTLTVVDEHRDAQIDSEENF
jgi:hypothetical protein